MNQLSQHRSLLPAERFSPELLHMTLAALEGAKSSEQVWHILVGVGERVNLPFLDFICAHDFEGMTDTIFIRTSYDSTWINTANQDPELRRWSYFRSHAVRHITPILIGYEFLDDYMELPEARVEILREAAARGMRAGVSVPMRAYAPRQIGMLSFMGDHSATEAKKIIDAHSTTLCVIAMHGFQRYMALYSSEYFRRHNISKKQRELMRLVGQGLLDKQISAILGISVSAVRQRLARVLEKTGLSNRTELAALAVSTGLQPDRLPETEYPEGEFRVEIGR